MISMRNWWYYHKWYVICTISLFLIFVHIIIHAFGFGKEKPDIQIAYVGESSLPAETVKAIQETFSSLAGDYNHDGKILVKINQFITGNLNDIEAASHKQASELGLIGDINDCESYFFLLENPDDFQKDFQLLAMPDGSCPAVSDISTDDKVFQWKSCSLLSKKELGTYHTTVLGQETSGNNQELLSSLYIGRRYFYGKKQSDNIEECNKLWDKLKGGLN